MLPRLNIGAYSSRSACSSDGVFGKIRQQLPGRIVMQFENTPQVEHARVLTVLIPSDTVLIHEIDFSVRVVSLIPRCICHLSHDMPIDNRQNR